MPAKKTRTVLITIRPRGGINDVEVGMFEHWVGTETKLLEKQCIVLEKTGDSRHLHAVLVYHKDTTQDNVKRKVLPIFAVLVATDTRWENPKIAFDCRAHHDPNGCVGGYLEKETHEVRSCVGFNQEELTAGRARRDTALERRRLHAPNKLNLVPNMINLHHHSIWAVDEDGNMDPSQYSYLSVPDKVDWLFGQIIRQGYINYIHVWSPALRSSIIRHWQDLTTVNPNARVSTNT